MTKRNGVRHTGRRTCASFAAVVSLSIAGSAMAAGSSTAHADWPAYQFSKAHHSYNAAATAITRSNASALRKVWTWRPPVGPRKGQPKPRLYASPAVFNGKAYIGSRTGAFFKISMTTGAVSKRRFVAFRRKLTCNAAGFVSSATVTPAPVSGRLVVYVGAPNGYVYALRASDLTTLWRTRVVKPSATENDYFLWSSPTVAKDRIYIGISSQCEHPLVDRAGVVALSQATGKVVGRYSSGVRGASVWSSVAVDPASGSVFATSGNPLRTDKPGDAYSIVRLRGAPVDGRLIKVDKWTIPLGEQTFDADFAASPTLFTAVVNGAVTKLVAACNKNGFLYAWRRARLSAGPVWRKRIGNPGSNPNSCIGGAAYDGKLLYQGSNNTTIDGVTVPGSVRGLDPATGAVVWQRPLNNIVTNTPTINGAGVLAVGTMDFGSMTNRIYLLNTSTGAVLKSHKVGRAGMFAQAVFADDTVLFPTVSAGMIAYRP